MDKALKNDFNFFSAKMIFPPEMCKTCQALILQEGRQDPRGSESALGFHSQEKRLEHRATIDVDKFTRN